MQDFIDQPFARIADLIALHAQRQPQNLAFLQGEDRLDYATLDRRMDQVAVALQTAGVQPGEAIAICAPSSIAYATVFLGALRAGVVVAPLAPSTTPQGLAQMVDNAEARLVFTDATSEIATGSLRPPRIALDGNAAAGQPLADWLAPEGLRPAPAAVAPAAAFNII